MNVHASYEDQNCDRALKRAVMIGAFLFTGSLVGIASLQAPSAVTETLVQKTGEPVSLKPQDLVAAEAKQETLQFCKTFPDVWAVFAATVGQLKTVLVSVASDEKVPVATALTSPDPESALNAVKTALGAKAGKSDRTWAKSEEAESASPKHIFIRVTMLPVNNVPIAEAREKAKGHYRTATDWHYEPTFEAEDARASPDGIWAIYKQWIKPSWSDKVRGLTIENWPAPSTVTGSPITLMTTFFYTIPPTFLRDSSAGVDSLIVVPNKQGRVDALFFVTVYLDDADHSFPQHMKQQEAYNNDAKPGNINPPRHK